MATQQVAALNVVGDLIATSCSGDDAALDAPRSELSATSTSTTSTTTTTEPTTTVTSPDAELPSATGAVDFHLGSDPPFGPSLFGFPLFAVIVEDGEQLGDGV